MRNGPTDAFRIAYGCYEVSGHKGRFGAAARYARRTGRPDEVLAIANRRLDSKLKRFLTWSAPKAKLLRLNLRGRKRPPD